ncbi:MAG: FG-GAP-like repeat-containing protein, partial [Cyclobacteriaceae bacterium]
MKFIVQTVGVLSSLFFLLSNVNGQDVSISFDSLNYETINLQEDVEQQFALSSMFLSDTNDTISFRITAISGTSIVEARINSLGDSLNLTPQENRFGQASVTISATNSDTDFYLEQQITVVVSPVDDAPIVNGENPLQDLGFDQFDVDTTLGLSLADRFTDVDEDVISITAEVENKSTGGSNFVDFDDASLTVTEDSLFISLLANTKHTFMVTLTATSNDTLSVSDTFDFVVDDAPTKNNTSISLDEDFGSVTYYLSGLFTDGDDTSTDFDLSFTDFLEGETIIENDTNSLILVRYYPEGDSIMLESKQNANGSYTLPITISSSERTVSEELVFEIAAVDDKPVVNNAIEDQLLPKNRSFRIELYELFRDIDNDIDFSNISISVDNPAPFEFKDQDENTLNLSSLTVNDSVVVVSVVGDPVGEKAIFTVNLDISTAFPSDDPVSDIFELEVSRAVINVYVSKEGDDANDWENGQALATIQKAIDVAQFGDTINIAAGTYIENISIKEGLIIRSELYEPTMTESQIESTVIKGEVNGGSVVNILRTDQVKLLGLKIQGSDGENTKETSTRNWEWVGDSSYDPSSMAWEGESFDNVPNDPNNRLYAIVIASEGSGNNRIESRNEWDWHNLYFEVAAGSDNTSFSGQSNFRYTIDGKDVYLTNNGYDLNGMRDFIQSTVPDGRMMVIESETQYDAMIADGQGYVAFGLINTEVVNGFGAGIYAQQSSFDLDKVIIENHQNTRSQWDNAAGILVFNSRKINVENSIIRNNTVQNGEASAIGVFWSDEFSLVNSIIQGNDVTGDNNCTASGFYAQGVQSVDIENAMFLDNEARCSHEIRISSVDNYTINHSLISKGINFQDVENRNGLVQNTIFLSGDMGNWGSTKPSKLKIRNNLINTGIWLDYEISSYGRNNILGGSANFEDAGAGNYRLKSTSTLIGAGISSSSTSDFDGNSRPSSGGSAPDIGPFENSLSKPELVFEPYTYVDATTSSDVQLRLETSVNWRNTYGLVEMVDLDQDGVDEIVFNEYLDNGVLKVISADGTQVTIHDEWDEYTVIKPMDINQDGYVDLVIANHSKIGYLYNDGNGIDASSFVEHTGFGVSTWDAEAIQWADLTSDGRVDAVLPEYSGIRIYDFEESAPTQQNLQLNNVDNQWLGDFGDAFVADINGDTRSDLILERRWYNKDAKDLLVFIQERNGFVYNEALSLIDVLEVPSNGDRYFDLQVISGDLDNDQLLDMIVTYEPSQAGGTGYLRRFELLEGSWNEVEAEIKLADESVVPFTDVFNVMINPKFVAVTEDDQLEIFAFVSDSRPENSDWERYYYPVLLELNDSSEFEVRQGYFSQELYRAHVNDAYQRPHLDFGFLNDDSSFDVVVTGRKESGKNSLVAFSNTYGFTPTEVPDPVIPTVTVRGSKLTVNLELETPYYNIKVCKDGNCNELVSSSGNGLDDKSAAIYTGAGSKEISYFLNPGSYNVSIQAIDQHLQTSNFVDSETVEVTGLIFQNGEKLFDDFFNSVNLINIDADEEPEVYGFKKRFWYNGGERPSSLRVFNLGEVDTSKDYVLDNTGESPLISDFDLNGQADILVKTSDCGWPQKPYATLYNIDENTSVDVFSESFVDLNIALDGGNCGAGITNNNLLIDIDQDGRDEVITAVVNEWDQEGLSIFAIESDDFDRNVVLRPSGEDVENWNGEDFDGFGALIKSRLDPSGRGHFIGLAHTYLDPDNDGDTDHLLAVNMQKGNPITALYFIETLGAGRVRAHYLNHFIDKSIIHLETVKDDDLTSRVIISVSDDTNYWLDAYSTRYVEFLNLDIANSDNLFEDMFDEAEAVSSENINPVNYRQNVNSALSYSEFEFEGIRLANLFETGDINNDGLTDVVVVGSNSYDTWNASAILNIYLQNEEGEFDPYISSISRGVKVFSFISSLNMIDMDGDAQFDVVVSGRLRFSNDGATIGFTNRTNTSEEVTLAAPDQLSGQNNGYKVQLDWNDGNEGKLSYAVQIGNAIDDYNISLGKLNQYGFPLFPDRFETFHPSKSLTFDAYDLADRYYFRVKAIDQYGNTSDFSSISEVSLSQPFVLMDQSIPGLEEGGIAWGDYDRDGDLDLAIMGKEDGFITAIFKNDSGTFVNTNQKLQKQSKGDLKWVDYDNDGFLDLIVVGLNPQLLPSLNIYKNVNGNEFVRQADSELPGLTDATLAFGDADADGDVDMVVAGIGEENGSIQYSFKLYTNRFNENSGRIFEMSPNFNYDGFVNGDIEFADLDNDGDLDIVYAGTGRGEQAVGGIIVNTRVGLSEQYNRYLYSNALSLKNASISVGDIDLDGDLDLITSGVSSNYNSVEQNVVNILYNNYYRIDSLRARINFREEVNTDITPLVDGDIDLTDFDNDGDLDILTSGADEFGNPQTLLYAQRSGDFFPVNAGFEHLS